MARCENCPHPWLGLGRTAVDNVCGMDNWLLRRRVFTTEAAAGHVELGKESPQWTARQKRAPGSGGRSVNKRERGRECQVEVCF